MRNVPWDTYLSLVAVEDRHNRIAFDQGVMEIMSPMKVHERVGGLLGRMVECWTETAGIEIQSVESTTFKRDELSKGFEADQSFYIQHEELVRELEEVDLTIHPGPDLVIEIDVTNSSLKKFGIYSALEVAEVWRWEGDRIRVYIREEHEFVESQDSNALPGFAFADAQRILSERIGRGDNDLIREFRQIADGFLKI